MRDIQGFDMGGFPKRAMGSLITRIVVFSGLHWALFCRKLFYKDWTWLSRADEEGDYLRLRGLWFYVLGLSFGPVLQPRSLLTLFLTGVGLNTTLSFYCLQSHCNPYKAINIILHGPETSPSVGVLIFLSTVRIPQEDPRTL